MKVTISATTILFALFFAVQTMACDDGSPNNHNSIKTISTASYCGDGKKKEGDGDGIHLFTANYCNKGDGEAEVTRLSINFCTPEGDGDGDISRHSVGFCKDGSKKDGDDGE
jgi:hypothetical protein